MYKYIYYKPDKRVVNIWDYIGEGDLYSIEEFVKLISSGVIHEENGMGNFAIEYDGKMCETEVAIVPEPYWLKKEYVEPFTHVIWYDK